MRSANRSTSAGSVWTEAEWSLRDQQTTGLALKALSEAEAWNVVVRQARAVLRQYSSSFYLVTRFLPPLKRQKVEAIYAAVRYPDEVVDTFPLDPNERQVRLDDWKDQYETALACDSIHEALRRGSSSFLVGFAKIVRETGIPKQHYHAFLQAMRLDSQPRLFTNLRDLIDNYIYGSAVVVGYFLTHVYGSVTESDFNRALDCSRNLGIALQLTNFLRDVGEDFKRGRIYLPQDLLRSKGIEKPDFENPDQHAAVSAVVEQLVAVAERYYVHSLADLDAFNEDSRVAIHACIKVYRGLNDRLAVNPFRPSHRESMPAGEKFRALPASKYWRVPLAYLTK